MTIYFITETIITHIMTISSKQQFLLYGAIALLYHLHKIGDISKIQFHHELTSILAKDIKTFNIPESSTIYKTPIKRGRKKIDIAIIFEHIPHKIDDLLWNNIKLDSYFNKNKHALTTFVHNFLNVNKY